MDFLTFMRNQWDRVAAWVLIALGGLLLLIGWLGVSDALLPTEQVPYIVSGGLGGICLIGIGVMLWLSADLRDEWSELHEIARRLGSESSTD
jgi:heme A synthase